MLRAVTPATVRAWWVGLGKDTPTSNTQAYQLLKTIYNTAVEDKAATENPCQIKSAGKSPKPRDVKSLTPAELVTVAESVPETYRAAVPVLAWCGLRFGELIELRRKDIHVEGDRMTLKIRRAATLVDDKVVVGPPRPMQATVRLQSRRTWPRLCGSICRSTQAGVLSRSCSPRRGA